jgi:hypothetical protein
MGRCRRLAKDREKAPPRGPPSPTSAASRAASHPLAGSPELLIQAPRALMHRGRFAPLIPSLVTPRKGSSLPGLTGALRFWRVSGA